VRLSHSPRFPLPVNPDPTLHFHGTLRGTLRSGWWVRNHLCRLPEGFRLVKSVFPFACLLPIRPPAEPPITRKVQAYLASVFSGAVPPPPASHLVWSFFFFFFAAFGDRATIITLRANVSRQLFPFFSCQTSFVSLVPG